MNNKKKVLLSSILSIALCLSLIAGSTFALFTSEATVNVAVTAGNVDVTATIDAATLKTYSMEREQPAGSFENGGSASFDADSVLQLSLMTPGDAVSFTIDVENGSNVNVLYRVRMLASGTLADALTVTAQMEGNTYAVNTAENVTLWQSAKAGETIDDIDVSVDFPDAGDANNAYKNAQATIAFVVEAVQGNAKVADYVAEDSDSLQEALSKGGIITTDGKKLLLDDGVGISTAKPITFLDAVLDGEAIPSDATVYGNGEVNLVMESGTEITAPEEKYALLLLFCGDGSLTMQPDSIIRANGTGAACIRVDNPSGTFEIHLKGAGLLAPTGGALGIEKTCAGRLNIYVDSRADYEAYKAMTAETDNYTDTVYWFINGVAVVEP